MDAESMPTGKLKQMSKAYKKKIVKRSTAW